MARIKLMTAEDLLNLENNGQRHELIRGELATSAPSGEAHGHYMGKLSHLIWRYLDDNPIALLAVGDPGYVLERDPDTLLAPDLAMTLIERLPGGRPARSFPQRVPDLVIDIVSPGDRIGMINEKITLYLDHGVGVVWLVDPDRQIVTEYAPNEPVRLLQSGDALAAEDRFPGLRIQVDEIFE